MRNGLAVLWTLLCLVTSAAAQVSVGVWSPGISIGINVPAYPTLAVVPGYPVYYAPQLNSNYFFYDGMYWVYEGDNWYASSWYNGPWALVAPVSVPVYVLRVPVRYYRQPPVYFRAWVPDAPPRWGEHWGGAWEQQRRGWDKWNRSSAPPPAPLPVYQRQYEGNRYPRAEQQQALHSQHYRYKPRDAIVQQQYQAQRTQSAPAASPQTGKAAPQERASSAHEQSRRQPAQQDTATGPRGSPPHEKGGNGQRPVTAQAPSQQPAAPVAQQQHQGAAQREQHAPRPQGQDKGPQDKGSAKEPRQDQEKGK